MAKRKEETKINYKAELQRLKGEAPQRLYLLWGPEDYLREQYLTQLKKRVLPEGEDSFSFKRFDGPSLDVVALRQAIDAMPFMSERSFIELHDVDLNKLKDSAELVSALSDIPDYCTVCFIQSAEYELDGRLKLNKFLREKGHELKFTQQTQGALIDWIARRFAACGKSVEFEAAQRLIFISGDLMNRLIPEIEKIAGYAKGEKVTAADVDAVAHHIPEAEVFTLTELIAQRHFSAAFHSLAELLADSDNEPIFLMAILGAQMRKLYAARIAIEHNLGSKYVMDTCAVKYDFIANKLLNSARSFTMVQLRNAVMLCAETDYRMKSSSEDDVELLKNAVLRIATGV